MPLELTDAQRANWTEGVRSRITPATTLDEAVRQIAEMLAFTKLCDGVDLTPHDLFNAVDSEAQRLLEPALSRRTTRELKLGERRERRALRRETLHTERLRRERRARPVQRTFYAALGARLRQTTPRASQPRPRAARVSRRVTVSRSCARRGPPSSSSGDDSPERPLRGIWDFLAASRRMLEHERRREARWRRQVAA